MRVLFVHQSADLYGSDKVLLSLLKGLSPDRFSPIVLLPCDGPLVVELMANGFEVHVVPMVRLSRATLSARGLVRLPAELVRSMRAIDLVVGGRKVDVVHSNTLAAFSGAVWAKMHGVPHIWHVHEMIVQPWLVRHMFPWLLRFFADAVPCNSTATQNLLLQAQPQLEAKSLVVWNGLNREDACSGLLVAQLRHSLGLGDDDVLVVLMGRINRWKGQRLLVDAAVRVSEMGLDNVHYLIVGSPPHGQEHYLAELKQKCAESGIADRISILGFEKDVWMIWDACDIAVVPSTEPEPFGMVALEAMAAKKPVIAAAHGGLVDIVVDGITGLLVTPNDPVALASAIADLALDSTRREEMGLHGWKRGRDVFSIGRYVSSFEALYKATIGGGARV